MKCVIIGDRKISTSLLDSIWDELLHLAGYQCIWRKAADNWDKASGLCLSEQGDPF